MTNKPKSNGHMYFEIQADDIKRAIGFYENALGWEFELNPSLPIEYYVIRVSPTCTGGILKRPANKPPQACGTNAYCVSFDIDDIDSARELILQNGGLVAMEKFALKGLCWSAYFLDTEGNVFGLFQPDENAE